MVIGVLNVTGLSFNLTYSLVQIGAGSAIVLLVLAALGAVLQERRGLDREQYAARHPAGALGKQARGE